MAVALWELHERADDEGFGSAWSLAAPRTSRCRPHLAYLDMFIAVRDVAFGLGLSVPCVSTRLPDRHDN